MAYYRLYSLGLNDRHITDVVDFNADGDNAAIAKVEADHGGSHRELWSHGRKVTAFAPRSDTDLRFEIYHEPSNRFANVIGSDGSWRWHLLDARNEVVAYGVGHHSAAKCQAAINVMRGINPKTPVAELA